MASIHETSSQKDLRGIKMYQAKGKLSSEPPRKYNQLRTSPQSLLHNRSLEREWDWLQMAVLIQQEAGYHPCFPLCCLVSLHFVGCHSKSFAFRRAFPPSWVISAEPKCDGAGGLCGAQHQAKWLWAITRLSQLPFRSICLPLELFLQGLDTLQPLLLLLTTLRHRRKSTMTSEHSAWRCFPISIRNGIFPP